MGSIRCHVANLHAGQIGPGGPFVGESVDLARNFGAREVSHSFRRWSRSLCAHD